MHSYGYFWSGVPGKYGTVDSRSTGTLKNGGVLKGGLRGLPMEPVTVPGNHTKIEEMHLKRS
jgi:hypothetical protein